MPRIDSADPSIINELMICFAIVPRGTIVVMYKNNSSHSSNLQDLNNATWILLAQRVLRNDQRVSKLNVRTIFLARGDICDVDK
jgi:hypothetical protein